MPHCDNDFETMALKHTLGVEQARVTAAADPEDEEASSRLLEGNDWDEIAKACECPYSPDYMDMAKQSWDNTRKSSGSFLKTLYRYAEVLMGKDLFRPGEGFSLSNLQTQ